MRLVSTLMHTSRPSTNPSVLCCFVTEDDSTVNWEGQLPAGRIGSVRGNLFTSGKKECFFAKKSNISKNLEKFFWVFLTFNNI